MENGKVAEEAGPSSGGGSGCSSASASACGKGEKQREMIQKTDDEVVANDDCDGDDDDADDRDDGFVPGPLIPLKEQLEKDKEDESLRRWKEKLLGCLEEDFTGQMDPEVRFHSIELVSEDLEEINAPLPVHESQKNDFLFILKEGSHYRRKITFTVLHNIVSGLTYSNTVWKGGFQVYESKGMLGTFAPQREPYVLALDDETTPSGVLARGTYSAKLKFQDDDRRCHMELKYSFQIKKRS
ncbi:hypothetical protein PVL29_008971 [Vitis rotundifolia]|uniref:Rho GDP-dissociation inhibitor 1 n=2 Tax=Vitis rotundifolia TaxID=103349 RepID=A0AA39DUV4_VITRO|nr:hypothetical protein PVL29_008971 [Vitis rotundifolia]